MFCQLSVREAVVKRKREALPLFCIELLHAARQRFRCFRLMQQFRRVWRAVLKIIEQHGVCLRDFQAGAAQYIQCAVAHDAGHPRHGCTFVSLVVGGVLPYIDEAVLQNFFRPIFSFQYAPRDAEQFR